MTISILDIPPKELQKSFLDEYIKLFPEIDREQAVEYIKTNQRFDELTEDWYNYLNANDLVGAYSVYDDDYYFTDMWNCFKTYSRRYLRDLRRPTLPNGQSIIELTSPAKCVVDIGCGIGYATSALTQLYPDSDVYGVNLADTKQWKFCEERAKIYNFNLVEDVKKIPVDGADVIFASEFFEHILDPLSLVEDIVDNLKPKYFIIANAFNTHATGHFKEYIISTKTLFGAEDIIVPSNQISRLFNKHLTCLGYERITTRLFNSKPNIWKRITL